MPDINMGETWKISTKFDNFCLTFGAEVVINKVEYNLTKFPYMKPHSRITCSLKKGCACTKNARIEIEGPHIFWSYTFKEQFIKVSE